MSDQTTIAFIRADKTDKTLDDLYNFFPAARKMILRNGGTRQDARVPICSVFAVFYGRMNSEND
jgi:hypothetical protein